MEKIYFFIVRKYRRYVRQKQMNGPYNRFIGVNKFEGASGDKFGNAKGSQFDLAKDGSFRGYTVILVVQYEDDYTCAIQALKRKGFDVKAIHSPLQNDETPLQTLLTIENSQLWFISGENDIISESDIKAVKNYFMKGHGVYIWGDNDPYFEDANRLLESIFGESVQLSGNDHGEKVLGIQQTKGGPGIIQNHPISTGIVNFYEGVTISSVSCSDKVKPLVYNSAGNVVTSFYDSNKRRLMIDGGFTRLFSDFWNTAGTERLVVNAAAWLANVERFGYHPQKMKKD